jgi:uncharacterized protein YndB with AHSA1/START domain
MSNDIADRTVTHSTFTLERTYPADPARVFAAWTDPEAKARWFVGASEGRLNVPTPMTVDFRVGGREHLLVETGDGVVYTFEGCFQDVVPDRRIVETTQMTKNGERISVSLVSVEFTPEGDGTRLVLTEHGAYLDGLDRPDWREEGTRGQLEAFAKEFTG